MAPPFFGGQLEAHGGYLLRAEWLDPTQLLAIAKAALVAEGRSLEEDCALQLSKLPQTRIIRLAFDAPFTYGRRGARWYERSHELARRVSSEMLLTVHAYVIDPSELEEVTTYGGGRRVGGERLVYEDFELPDDLDDDDEDGFERLKERWPLGHLARVLGVTRRELMRLPREKSCLLELDGRSVAALTEFWRPAHSTG